MENNIAKATEITETLKKIEKIDLKRFMAETDAHFRISCDREKDYQMIKFVAEKCFQVGYRRGMMAVFDALEEHRKEQVENN